MTVIKETTHVLDNLFCLQPDSKFHAYLLENARLGLSIMDYVISGKELRGENGSRFEMSDYEASLIAQLDDYEPFCHDNNVSMDTYFPLLECTKEEFNRSKRGEPCESTYREPPHVTNQLDSEPIPIMNGEGGQVNALNVSKGQCSMTNEDCINSSCSSLSSEDITSNPLTHSTASKETSSSISSEDSSINEEPILRKKHKDKNDLSSKVEHEDKEKSTIEGKENPNPSLKEPPYYLYNEELTHEDLPHAIHPSSCLSTSTPFQLCQMGSL